MIMSNGRAVSAVELNRYDLDPRLTEGVIGRRVMGYLVDFVMIGIWSIIMMIVISVVGLLTFGLGWSLFALVPLTAIIYNAVTISGRSQATVGMRMAGLRVVDATTGGRVGFIVAAVHALLFYVAVSTFLLWVCDVLVGFFRNDGRFVHDLLTGVVLIRD
jgi:uncharacterized RDD family membrane protein YckC